MLPRGDSRTFDVVTLIHVLEHIAEPTPYLTRLQQKLTSRGLLLIQVPDYSQNPFDLLIADHCTHFTPTTAARLLDRTPYQLNTMAADWVPKELTLLITPTANGLPKTVTPPLPSAVRASVEQDLAWLIQTRYLAQRVAERGAFGLFGTSIAATWLVDELGDAVRFFVDEDPHRAGKTYLGRPVYLPGQVPEGSHVFVALPPSMADRIRNRIAGRNVVYHVPSAR